LELSKERLTTQQVQSEMKRVDNVLNDQALKMFELGYQQAKAKGKEIKPELQAAHDKYVKAEAEMAEYKAMLPAFKESEAKKKSDAKAPEQKYSHPSQVPDGGVWEGMKKLPGPWKDKKSWEKL